METMAATAAATSSATSVAGSKRNVLTNRPSGSFLCSWFSCNIDEVESEVWQRRKPWPRAHRTLQPFARISLYGIWASHRSGG
ncbi:hypothetical protein MLD38_025057 [Melastoma candidum]|uniref:Uncharacterized protein n=1 Tax=Melastoma candidum TaxID=119954 RepID=A0ACB9NU72_9MYRT|nr:hypothetical protein MLD38_025057 [Melastoma candidum]